MLMYAQNVVDFLTKLKIEDGWGYVPRYVLVCNNNAWTYYNNDMSLPLILDRSMVTKSTIFTNHKTI